MLWLKSNREKKWALIGNLDMTHIGLERIENFKAIKESGLI